jgi:hypothetical protein
MFKHIEDDGDLSIVVDDKGSLLVVCSKGHTWLGSLEPASSAPANRMESMVNALQAGDMLDRLGVDAASLR